MNENREQLIRKMVGVIEVIGDQTAYLTASGDPLQAVCEPSGAAMIAGNIRGEIRQLKELCDNVFAADSSF